MADKIDSLTLPNSGGTTTTYDIDLPPDATPSIASLTVTGNNSEYIKTPGQSGFYKADGTISTPSNQKIKVGSVTFGAGDEINIVNDGNMNIVASTTGEGAPKISFAASNTNYYHTPSYSTGLKIGTGVGVSDLYVPDAGQNQSGVVNTSSQGFYGPKTFHSSITVNSSISAGGTIESNSSVNSWGPNEDAPTDSSVVDWENHSFLGKFWNNCISCINDDTGDEYIYAFPNKSGVINFGTEIVDLRNINE